MEFLTLRCSQKIRQKTALAAAQQGSCLLTAELGLILPAIRRSLLLRGQSLTSRGRHWGKDLHAQHDQQDHAAGQRCDE